MRRPLLHAVTDDALGTDDAVGLLERLRSRQVSAAELQSAAQTRARAIDDRLAAVVDWVEPQSLRPPPSPDGPLAGVPTVVKNNEPLAGYPTVEGSAALPRTAAHEHSPFVAQLLELGLTPVATTTLPEFGLTASTESSRFGATRNPWHPASSAGGSSGGSAALVAAGAVPIAHANDGGGSIRIPAACCGLVGLKPSRGRLVERPELARLPVPITTQGVLTRTVRDTALYFAEAERRYQPHGLPPIGHVRHPAPQRLRVGLVVDAPHGIPVSGEVVGATTAAASALSSLGHHVEPVAVPVDERFGPDFLVYWQLLALGLQRGGRWLYGPGFDPSRTEAFTQYLAKRCLLDLPRVPGALRRLRRLARAHERIFDSYDLLLSPVLAHAPPPIGQLGPDVDPRTHLVRLLRWTAFTPLQNVSGSPALSLPLGLSRAGLPLGVQLAAPFGHERRLLEVAHELEHGFVGHAGMPSRTSAVGLDG